MGPTSPCVLLFLSALLISGNAQDLPTATVDVTFPLPPPHYTNDRVFLRCDISEYNDWSYIWWVNGQDYRGCTSKVCIFILGSDNTLGLNTVKYRCRGKRSGQPQFSRESPEISVKVTALPTATVNTLSPPAPHYPGDSVTLQCDISQYEDWSLYYWVINDLQDRGCTSKTCTIKLVDHGFRHSCKGRRSGRPQESERSPTSTTALTALPKALLTVTPNPVYHGETVSLKCSVDSGPAWSYKWFKDRAEITEDMSDRHRISGDTLTITNVETSDQGQYQCSGELRSLSSRSSSSQYLNFHALPTATVNTISPPAPHYPGDSVTLQCDISQYEDWSLYYWVINDREYGVCTSKTCTIKLVDHGFNHSCEGRRSGRPQISQRSPTSTTASTALPTATLTVTPNPVYHGETVSLKCSVDSGPAWSYKWFKDRAEITEDTFGRHNISGDTLTITNVETSDQGQYQCSGAIPSRNISSVFSDSISITVKAGPVTLESPVQPVSEGDSVTLRCRQEPPLSNPKVDFYKDGHLIRKDTTGEMTIPAVSLSDEGLYKCSYSDRGESPQSWLLVRGTVVPVQSATLVSKLLYGLLGVAVFLVITVLLFLLIKRLRSVKTAKEDEGAELNSRSQRDRSLDNTGL